MGARLGAFLHRCASSTRPLRIARSKHSVRKWNSCRASPRDGNHRVSDRADVPSLTAACDPWRTSCANSQLSPGVRIFGARYLPVSGVDEHRRAWRPSGPRARDNDARSILPGLTGQAYVLRPAALPAQFRSEVSVASSRVARRAARLVASRAPAIRYFQPDCRVPLDRRSHCTFHTR